MPASITGSLQGWCCLFCSLTTWAVGWNEPSASCWTTPDWEEWYAGRQRCQTQHEFNKDKCEVLHVGQNNPMYRYGLAAKEWESSFAENVFWWVTSWRGVRVPSQQRGLAACSVALGRTYLACQGKWDHVWSTRSSLGISSTRKTLTSLSKPSQGRRDVVYEERLRQLGLTLKKRRGVDGLSRARPFSEECGERMRGNRHKLQEGKFSWGKRRKFFTEWSNDGGRAQISCGIFLPADIPNLAVQAPEQWDLTLKVALKSLST